MRLMAIFAVMAGWEIGGLLGIYLALPLNGGCGCHLAEVCIHEIVSVGSSRYSSTSTASGRFVEMTRLRVAAQLDPFDASCP
jgi:hypothetical protein